MGVFKQKNVKELSSVDLKTLGINEEKFKNLSPKDQKNFIRLHALDESILLKDRKSRPRPDPEKSYKTTFRQILDYLWIPYKNIFLLTLVLSVVQALLFLGLPIMLQVSITDLLDTLDLGVVAKDIVIILVLMGCLAITMYIRMYMNNWIGNNIIKDLRDAMFKQIQSSTYNFLDLHPTGDLISRNTSDLNLLKNLLSSQLALFIRQSLMVFFSIIAMFVIFPEVAIYAVIPIPIIFIIMLFYRSKIRPTFSASRETYGDLTSVVQENITGMRVVRAFAQEKNEVSKFKKQNDKYFNQNQQLIFFQASFEPLIRLLANISILLTIYFGTNIAASNFEPEIIGKLFAMITLINFSIEPLFFISRFLGDMSKVGATCDRVCEILNNRNREPNQDYEPTQEALFNLKIPLTLIAETKSIGQSSRKLSNLKTRFIGVLDGSKDLAGVIDLDLLRDKSLESDSNRSLNSLMQPINKELIFSFPYDTKQIEKLIRFHKPEFIILTEKKQKNYDLVLISELFPDFKPDLPRINGEVEFKEVVLAYGGQHEELKNISFKTKPGEQIAILGATGSGKSSLIRLIPRFYKIKSGSILVDGNDIQDYNYYSLRKQIGIVPQETFLFGRSLLENLRLGRPDAPMEEIIHACSLSNIHEFIDSLPEKYDTILGERGVTLSGGQKQRVAIARALILQPRILILDDATSAVDVDTEYLIQQSFKEMFQNATIFIITQRLSTVRNADRIMVLDHGKIEEIGSHNELLEKENGIYSKLYNTLKVEERANA